MTAVSEAARAIEAARTESELDVELVTSEDDEPTEEEDGKLEGRDRFIRALALLGVDEEAIKKIGGAGGRKSIMESSDRTQRSYAALVGPVVAKLLEGLAGVTSGAPDADAVLQLLLDNAAFQNRVASKEKLLAKVFQTEAELKRVEAERDAALDVERRRRDEFLGLRRRCSRFDEELELDLQPRGLVLLRSDAGRVVLIWLPLSCYLLTRTRSVIASPNG